ncbi:hypothetical protein LguiB_013848 [Lonicera macranthoides]
MPASIPVWGIKILDPREEQVSMAHGELNSIERTDDGRRRLSTEWGMEVHIVNGLPNNTNPLELFCQSKDTHFGYHKLNVGDEFYWKFHNSFAGKTLYWCRFYWGNLVRSIKVYDDHAKFPNCVYEFTLRGSKCYWSVKEDGFYSCKHFEQNCFEWVKSYDWTGESA